MSSRTNSTLFYLRFKLTKRLNFIEASETVTMIKKNSVHNFRFLKSNGFNGALMIVLYDHRHAGAGTKLHISIFSNLVRVVIQSMYRKHEFIRAAIQIKTATPCAGCGGAGAPRAIHSVYYLLTKYMLIYFVTQKA